MKLLVFIVFTFIYQTYASDIAFRSCDIQMLEVNKNIISIEDLADILHEKGYRLNRQKLIEDNEKNYKSILYVNKSNIDGPIILVSTPSIYHPLLQKTPFRYRFYDHAFKVMIKKLLDNKDFLKGLNQKYYAIVAKRESKIDFSILFNNSYVKVPVLNSETDFKKELLELLNSLPDCR